MTKVCTKCRKELSLSEFSQSSYKRQCDGFYSLKARCKECIKEDNRASGKKCYKEHRDKYYGYYKRARLKKLTWFIEFRKSLKCADCGTTDWRVLEFDHDDPVNKSTCVSRLVTANKTKILEEAAKCTVRCANCHHIRTFEQFSYYKELM